MLLAFMVAAHTDYEQLIRLCIKLQGYGDVYIHVDKNTNDGYYNDLKCFVDSIDSSSSSKLKVLEKRVVVKWGSFSQVNALRVLLEDVVDEASPEYDRIIYLSGLDYPLYSFERLKIMLAENEGKELMTVYNISRGDDPIQLQKVILYHFFRNINLPHNSFIRKAIIGGTKLLLKYIGIRKKPYLNVEGKRWDVYFSSQWFILTRECAKHVLCNLNTNKELIRYFKTSYCPEEMIVATIVANSKFGKNVRVIKSPDFEEVSMFHHLHYTDKIWTYDETDFDCLMKSNKPFVRKLVSDKSEKLIAMIDNFHKSLE